MTGDASGEGYVAPDLSSRAAFEAAAGECYGRVVRAVYLATGDAGAAEDAVQEALAKAWLGRRSVRSLPAFLTKVALNQARSSWRRRRRELTTDPQALLAVAEETSRLDGGSLSRNVRVELLRLPQRQREAVVLHDFLEFSFVEAAQILGTSPEALRNAAFHGRRQLRDRIPHLGGEPCDAE